jgi:hypothetical protein
LGSDTILITNDPMQERTKPKPLLAAVAFVKANQDLLLLLAVRDCLPPAPPQPTAVGIETFLI